MKKRMTVKQLVENAEQVVQSFEDDDIAMIEIQAGQRNPDLVLMTKAEFERLQAGQRNPDAAAIDTTSES